MSLSNTPGRSKQGLRPRSDGKTTSAGRTVEAIHGENKKKSLGVRILSLPIVAYRLLISPLIGPRCRYLPTCSEYALDALAQHGAIRGGWLALRRMSRCHPLGGAGFDPVPPKAWLEETGRH